jgi:hypothetical protein
MADCPEWALKQLKSDCSCLLSNLFARSKPSATPLGEVDVTIRSGKVPHDWP